MISTLSPLHQVDLEEEKLQKKALSLTLGLGLCSLHIFLMLVSLALIGGAFFGIFKATVFSQVSQKHKETKQKLLIGCLAFHPLHVILSQYREVGILGLI